MIDNPRLHDTGKGPPLRIFDFDGEEIMLETQAEPKGSVVLKPAAFGSGGSDWCTIEPDGDEWLVSGCVEDEEADFSYASDFGEAVEEGSRRVARRIAKWRADRDARDAMTRSRDSWLRQFDIEAKP